MKRDARMPILAKAVKQATAIAGPSAPGKHSHKCVIYNRAWGRLSHWCGGPNLPGARTHDQYARQSWKMFFVIVSSATGNRFEDYLIEKTEYPLR